LSQKVDLKINWCTHEAAKYAVENWHYSKSLPVPPHVRLGAWESEKYIGCVIFSRGASPDLLKPYGLTMTECCELTRIALNKHITPVSRIMARALAFLKRSNPGLKLIVSFADPSEGHHGGVYQATNWIYTGQSAPGSKYIDLFGREWHPRQVSSTGFRKQFGAQRRAVKASDCKKISTPGKHRYLLPLTQELRERILPLSKPYPKRAGSRDNAASGFQSEEGGASPTPALQISSEVSS
jgi:hypothetical protein